MLQSRSVTIWALAFTVAVLLASAGHAQELHTDLSLLGQVREGDFTRETETPLDLHGDMGVTGLPHRTSIDTFFRAERDFAADEGSADFYAGYLHASALPGVDVTLGRQFLSEGPGGAFVADAGKLRINTGGPLSFTVFGGRPRYFEPTFSSNILSEDEVLFGGSVRTARWRGGQLGLGYLQHEREDKVLRQLITGTVRNGFEQLPGTPSLYASVAYDADRQNLDLASVGIDVLLRQPRLQFNFEGNYYRPQDREQDRPITDLDRREDAIFEVFSVSEMVQWRGALRYPVSQALSAFGDYSYQHYEQQKEKPREVQNSHVASAGLVWLPGGDGLEVLRLEYYVIDTEDDNLNGGKAYYESRVYERLFFRTKFNVTRYEKENNQSDTAISGLMGLGFVVVPGLTCELDFEGNHNDRFDEDYRFGFVVNYNARHRVEQGRIVREAQ